MPLLLLLLLASPAGAADWVQGAGGPPPLGLHAMATFEQTGTVVVFGGRDGDTYSNRTLLLSGDSWSEGPAAPAGLLGRIDASMAYDRRRNVIVLFGGRDPGTKFDDTWEFDGTTWLPGPAAPAGLEARSGAAMTYDDRRGRIVLVSGSPAGQPNLDDVWEYDGSAWMPGVSLPPGMGARWRAASAYDESRGVTVVYGGRGDVVTFDDTWEYDGSAWVQGPAAPPALGARTHAAMAFHPGDSVIVLVGGMKSGSPHQSDVWEYDGSAWRPSPAVLPEPRPRFGHAMATDITRGEVVLFAGVDEEDLNDTWFLGAAGWRSLEYPLARRFHAMAYDAARNVGVMFGGRTGNGIVGDTWELGANGWRQVIAPGPGPREGAAMEYDGARQRMVMFGGGGSPTSGVETWEYDGTAWTPGPAAPPALTYRSSHAMAYDSGRQVVMLFGGFGSDGMGNPFYLDDTWEYDGVAWTPGPAAPAGMPPRMEHAMEYDAGRAVVVLYGGYGPPGVLDDVWEYDGVAWRPGVPMPGTVSPRLAHSMTYDLTRGRLVMFGGGDDPDPDQGNTFTDVWELSSSGWQAGTPGPAEMAGRRFHDGYYDVRRQRTVIFAGAATYNSHRGDVWEYGAVRETIVAGAGFGSPNPNRVAGRDGSGSSTSFDVLAYSAGSWGAVGRGGNVAGDDLDEVVTGPGPGPVHGPHVRAFRADSSPVAGVSYFAYGTLRYGVDVASGDLDADGWDEIVSGAGAGPVFGPHVRGWDVDGGAPAPMPGVSFFAYSTLRYGVSVGCGDIDGDGKQEILTGPGPGPFLPHVRGFDVDGGGVRAIAKVSFVPSPWYSSSGGALLASGDVDGDGIDEIAVTSGASPGALAEWRGYDYDGVALEWLTGFSLVPGASQGGRVALVDVVGNGREDLVMAFGPNPLLAAVVETYRYDGLALTRSTTFDAFPGLVYGVNVGGAWLGL